MGSPAISVVIVAYRQREALKEALESGLAAIDRLGSEGGELLVVDNGEMAGFVREQAPAARLLEPDGNLGFAGGVQLALGSARGEWVALVNDDARIEAGSLAALLRAGRRDERVGSVAAQVRFQAAPGLINSAGISVDTLGIATERLVGRPCADAAAEAEVFGACGCFALYRRAMLEQVGGFEERFFAYLEDVDLAWRARAAGWSAVYEPGAVAYHRGSATSGEGSAFKYSLVGRNRVWVLARNATGRRLARSLPAILLYDLAYVVFVALTDRSLAPLRGRLAGLRRWREMRREGRRGRAEVELAPAWRGWLESLRMRRAYRELSAGASAEREAAGRGAA